MPTIKPYKKGSSTIKAKTRTQDESARISNSRWWTIKPERELAQCIMAVVQHLKQVQEGRQKQARLYALLYGNIPLWNYLGGSLASLNSTFSLPADRATMNVIQSCVDSLVSRLVQSKPKPMFLTSAGDYKRRELAKDLNRFIDGEFYRIKFDAKKEFLLRDGCILGDGMFKVYETDQHTVGLERTLSTQIFVDEADSRDGSPTQMHEMKLVDKDVLAALFPEKRNQIMNCDVSYWDTASRNQDTIVSQVAVVESWHLKSGPDMDDGRHVISIQNCTLLDEDYEEDDFPFVRFGFAPRTTGYWSQGLCEQLMGTQVQINYLLYTIQQGLHLCAVPKWLVEDGSKIVSAHINNQIGGIIKYQGTAPVLQSYQVFQAELYMQLERLIQFAYQQSGVSQLAATSKKPQGLDSGAALREYDDLQADRFAYLQQRVEKLTIDLAYKVFKQAKKIAERDGKYETIYPGKSGIQPIELPLMDLKGEEFVIQCYPVSGYSSHPAFKKQEIIDDMQAGLISPDEGRRLLDFPDLQQEEDLLNAPKERILKVLDDIVEKGKEGYEPPDPYMDLQKAKTTVLQYYNKYTTENLEEEKRQLLRDWNAQIDLLTGAANPQPMMDPMAPQAAPEPPPTSDLIPNVPQVA